MRAFAFYYSLARERHPIITHVWSQFDGDPGVEGLSKRIDELCTEIVESSRTALEKLRSRQGYRLLGHEVTVTTVGSMSPLAPTVVEQESGRIADLMGLRSARAPEAALAGLLAARSSTVTRMGDPLAEVAHAVTVWDLDALRAAALKDLGTQVGPVERAALEALDWAVFTKTLKGAVAETAVRRALDIALGPTGLGVAIDALLGVIDGVYDYVSYYDQALLAKSELLSQSAATRRILTANPSLAPLFLDLVGSLGDAAAVMKWPRVASRLRQLHLSAFVGVLGTEALPLLRQLAVAAESEEKPQAKR
jgi:hypothetical protein